MLQYELRGCQLANADCAASQNVHGAISPLRLANAWFRRYRLELVG